MTKKEHLHLLLIQAFGALALGGWLLHLGLHPPAAQARNYIPFVAGLLSVTLIPLGFWFKATLEYDYVLNGMMVIIGGLCMTVFSLQQLPAPLTPAAMFTKTMLPEIIILLTSFLLGKALFDLEQTRDLRHRHRGKNYWRYPNMGWWGVHVMTLSTVFMLGYLLWK